MNIYRTVLYSIIFFTVCCFPSTNISANQDGIAEWLGARFRLVWLQDHGDGSDSLAHGKNLMLYGYDSQDGRGERPLINRKGDFFKPLLTPDGKQVIVSARRSREIFLLDWDNGGIERLGQGVAVAVWREPKNRFFFMKPRVWIYYFAGEKPENKYGTTQPLYRFPMDNPEKKELVWNRSVASWSNVQLSRDGQILGGLFPWPHGGVIWEQDNRWQRFGKGCWTSLSPDNSKLLWIFDGLHRNVEVYDVVNGGNWKININDAPGIDGYEVYHPRWSNHPRYFVITGPYEKGEGGNRIGGGGEKVEIYIGRFDEQVKAVESWRQVTHNRYADFYPDLWVEGGGSAQLEDTLPAVTASPQEGNWPIESDRLVFLWDNLKTANQLSEESPIGYAQCNIELRGQAVYTRNLRVNLSGGWGDTGESGKEIGRALAISSQGALELLLKVVPTQHGNIVTFSNDTGPVLSVNQIQGSLELSTGPNKDAVRWPAVFIDEESVHLALNFQNNAAELFVNGKSKGKKTLAVDLVTEQVQTFWLGEKDGSFSGIVGSLGIYDTPLSSDQVEKNNRLVAQKDEEANPLENRVIIEGKPSETTTIPAPESIGAYSRALVVNSYQVENVIEGQYDHEKIVVAEWAVMDRKVVKEYSDESVRMTLDKFSEHPELEGERLMMDIFEPDLDMYYRIPRLFDDHSS